MFFSYQTVVLLQYKRSRSVCCDSRAVAFAPRERVCFARLYELEEYDLSVVTLTRAQLEDPGVAALTVSILRSDFLE